MVVLWEPPNRGDALESASNLVKAVREPPNRGDAYCRKSPKERVGARDTPKAR